MTGFGPNKRKSMMTHESINVPINHRDASASSASHWKNAPTAIPVPGAGDRQSRPHSHSYSRGTNSRAPERRPHDNPYSRMTNNLSARKHPGNPNVLQTVLAIPPDLSIDDSRPLKRARRDSASSMIISNGASSSYPLGPAPCSSVSEPDIQMMEPPRTNDNRRHPIRNDAEIIELGASSDDLGERVPRVTKSSSPCPTLLTSERVHAFDTHPTQYSLSSKGKGRAKEPPEIVEGSEEDEDIKEFSPPPRAGRPPHSKEPCEIPPNIVTERRRVYEPGTRSAPAAVRHPTAKGVKSVDLKTGGVVHKMKKKDEHALGHQSSAHTLDGIATSSSNFKNSARDKTQTLPLIAWCLGQNLFEHSESAPLDLVYEFALQRIRVTRGRSPPEKIQFRLDRDVNSVMIVNDSETPLKENVVVQFNAQPGATWNEVERKYKGFKPGMDRGRGVLTFYFSTARDRGSSPTDYQQFVTGIRKAFSLSDIQIIQPSKGATVWDYATRVATMFGQTESRNGKKDNNENVPDGPAAPARSVTPRSSTSKTGLELKLSNGDPGSSIPYRRSARQSAIRSSRASPPPPPPPPPAQLELDEVILMYPPAGTGALNIMHSDLRRLQPEEFLNDTLIEFGLKLWLNDLREKNPALADQIHVFSSFFYKKLNNRKNAEDGYKSVRKWTSKISLFTKKYVIVPINENIHWYLAIIYEPGHTLEPPLLLPQSQLSSSRMTRKQKQGRERAKACSETLTEASLERVSPAVHGTEAQPEADTSSVDATRTTTPSLTGNEEMDDAAITVFDKSCSISAANPTSSDIQIRDSSPILVHPPSDSMDVDAGTSFVDVVPNRTHEVVEVLEPSTSKPSSGVPVSQFYGPTHKPGDVQPVVIEDNEDSGEEQRQEAEVDDMLAVTQSPTADLPPQTYIFTLDSLGTRHPQAIKVLKNYLRSEAKDKRNYNEVRDAVGKQVQVPVQPNTWDCGIYLLHFVKVLMSSPSELVEQILSTRGTMPSLDRKKMWHDHEIPQFRDYLQARIIQLSEEWKADKIEEEANKRRSGDALEVEVLSSEGEVDIVEDIPTVKAIPGSKQKQPAVRLRG